MANGNARQLSKQRKPPSRRQRAANSERISSPSRLVACALGVVFLVTPLTQAGAVCPQNALNAMMACMHRLLRNLKRFQLPNPSDVKRRADLPSLTGDDANGTSGGGGGVPASGGDAAPAGVAPTSAAAAASDAQEALPGGEAPATMEDVVSLRVDLEAQARHLVEVTAVYASMWRDREAAARGIEAEATKLREDANAMLERAQVQAEQLAAEARAAAESTTADAETRAQAVMDGAEAQAKQLLEAADAKAAEAEERLAALQRDKAAWEEERAEMAAEAAAAAAAVAQEAEESATAAVEQVQRRIDECGLRMQQANELEDKLAQMQQEVCVCMCVCVRVCSRRTRSLTRALAVCASCSAGPTEGRPTKPSIPPRRPRDDVATVASGVDPVRRGCRQGCYRRCCSRPGACRARGCVARRRRRRRGASGSGGDGS